MYRIGSVNCFKMDSNKNISNDCNNNNDSNDNNNNNNNNVNVNIGNSNGGVKSKVIEMNNDLKNKAQATKISAACACKQIFSATVIAGLNGLLVGSILAFSAIFLPQLSGDSNISKEQQSWIASVPNLGQLLGSLSAGALANMLGRKRTMMLYSLPLLAGWLVIVFSGQNWGAILAGRLLNGFGMMPGVAQVYLSEMLDDTRRNQLGSMYAISISIGITLCYVLGGMFHWQDVCWVFASLTAAMLAAVMWLPESPSWLVMKGRLDKAEKALVWLRGGSPEEIKAELELLKTLNEHKGDSEDPEEADGGKPDITLLATLKEVRQPEKYKPLVVLVTLWLFQQYCGNYAVIFYAVDIFSGIGVKTAVAEIMMAMNTTSNSTMMTAMSMMTMMDEMENGNSSMVMMKEDHLLDYHAPAEVEATPHHGHHALSVAHVAATVVGLMRILSSVVGTILVSRFSKKKMLIASTAMMTVFMSALAITVYVKTTLHGEEYHWLRWLPIAETSGFIFAYGLGMNIIPWILVGELIQGKFKSISSAVSMFICAGSVFIIVKFFPLAIEQLQPHGCYSIFSAICFCSLIFTVFVVPDTTGKSLEELQDLYKKKP